MNKNTIKVSTNGKHAKIDGKIWDKGGTINEN
ncbi:Uncharacterised protein [uncultured archaeon]|nr:Uncharacterised protein [uncultured archaeon]